MRGFKGTNLDMTCQGFQYEVGKTYFVEGQIRLCAKGFHFCERLEDVFGHYPRGISRYFEVEADGEIVKGYHKCVSSRLTIVRELPEFEVNRKVYGDDDGCGNGYDGNGYGNGNIYGYGNDGFGGGEEDEFGDGYGYGYGDRYGFGGGYGFNFGEDDGNRTYWGNDGNIQRICLYAPHKEVNNEGREQQDCS